MYDVLVVGGGPAGLTGAINCASEGRSTALVCPTDKIGGQIIHCPSLENFIGYPDGITGDVFIANAVAQANKFGVDFIDRSALKLGLCRDDDDSFYCTTEDQSVIAKTVLIATGLDRQYPPIENENEHIHKGACLHISDANSRHCIVVGGGNAAAQAALYLYEKGAIVTLLTPAPNIGAGISDYLAKRLRQATRMFIITGAKVDAVRSRYITYQSPGYFSTMSFDELFLFSSLTPSTAWLSDLVNRTYDGYLLNAKVPGIFIAGDIRSSANRRLASAIGSAADSVSDINRYLNLKEL